MKKFDVLLKYEGRVLDTDEYAEAINIKNKLLSELEELDFKTGEDSLLLKWGTIKGINFKGDKADELLHEYNSNGTSVVGVMMQQDNNRQKEIICKLIDMCDGLIQNDWSGNYMTKQEAKEYVLSYK